MSPAEPVSALDGFVLVDKPAGLTSQQVVSRVKRQVGARKAGHAGTLDPMATGLLIVGLGKATRLLGYIADKDKQYEATIRLGQATSTDDAEGEPVGPAVDASGLTDQAIAAALARFGGSIEQVPSSVSAIKVGGRRAYDLARAGHSVDLAARAVRIDQVTVTGRVDQAGWVDLDLRIDCSPGTYIRALARDLGRDLGVGGHVTALRRSRIGGFAVTDAVVLDELGPGSVRSALALAEAVAPLVEVDQATARAVGFGRAIDLTTTGLSAIVHHGRLLGLYRSSPEVSGLARPVVILVDPADLVSPAVSSVKNSTPGTSLPALSSVTDVTASPPSSALAARPQTPPSYSPNLRRGTLADQVEGRDNG